MSKTYSLTLRLVHWLTAFMIVTQVALAILNRLLYEPRPVLAEWLVQAHISLGVTILILTLCRVVLRLHSPVPPRSSSTAVRITSSCAHTLLYLLLIALPVSGYVRLAALGFEIMLFGEVPLPPLKPNVALAMLAKEFHDIAALFLGSLLVAHISAAVFHNYLDGKAVLGHMRI